MEADEHPTITNPLEERLRRILRYGGGSLLLVTIVVLALADTFGSSSGVHVEPFVFGALVSSFLLIVGIDVIPNRLGNGKR